ncbi:MAG: metalloregulator ArsR/SmtB family transcription factor [Candidatus Eisenbacteria bacterium]
MREVIKIAKALSDEGRVRVVMALRARELCACEIVELLGLSTSTVSRHMSVLQSAGLVEGRKNGRWVYYRLADDGAHPGARGALEWVTSRLSKDATTLEDEVRVTGIIGCRVESCES